MIGVGVGVGDGVGVEQELRALSQCGLGSRGNIVRMCDLGGRGGEVRPSIVQSGGRHG